MKIKALRMFSHYHLGTVSLGESLVVKKEIGDVLVKLRLAEEIEPENAETSVPEQPVKAKSGGKGGNKRGADGADKDASEG
ncbi:hypothetical protein RQL66_025500 [Citrobacter freundii]|uniref:hypothetical protein n=1 Tax=Citrobacter freundii TaxID=546 RepID=UPI001BCD0D29|nr:hypothetical protein [Citrobacter freundii]MDT7142288.1 hypothetical protein [Citrobacter freundii]MDT7213429.1 hypothetical protein [Citrobacter freundii]MDT7221231.1 hypothetical protein [Citrobacter freundii]MDT7268817.1 hypothetical protein [Citrobacter freundii]